MDVCGSHSAVNDCDSPERLSVARDELKRLQGRIRVLPEQQQTALVLRGNGANYEEIAAELKITDSYAKQLVSLARGKIASLMHDT